MTKVVTISGPSGVGKSVTLEAIQRLAKNEPWSYPVSVTTRAPRPGEIEGVHYNFITEEKFQEELANGAFIETATVHTYHYGLLRREVEKGWPEIEKSIMIVEIEGMKHLKQTYPDLFSIFMVPGDFSDLAKRLEIRPGTTEEEKALRLTNAIREISEKDEFDIEVINFMGKLDLTVKTVAGLIKGE